MDSPLFAGYSPASYRRAVQRAADRATRIRMAELTALAAAEGREPTAAERP